ncbi:MAG: SAF domain-containing protein [Acidimicrobiales bacterium]
MRISLVGPHHRPKLRTVLHRTRTRWLLTAFVAVISVAWTISTVTAAQSATSSWGTRRTVPIALTHLEPGRVITESDIAFSDRPIALLPTNIAESPVGRTVTKLITENETVLETRLAGGSANGPTALLEANTIAFALPIEANTPTLRIGDEVQLFAPSEVIATASRGSGPAVRISARSVVVGLNENTVMVGVTIAESANVARALLSGALLLALTD